MINKIQLNNINLSNGYDIQLSAVHNHTILPSNYTRVTCIISNNTQWIDTGYIPNQDTRVYTKMVCIVKSKTNWAFGTRIASKDTAFAFAGSTSGIYNSPYGDSVGVIDKSFNSDEPIIIDKNKNITYINNILAVEDTYTTFVTKNPLLLCACDTNGSIAGGSVSIYFCQIYDNGILVRDYIPVKDENGVYGLYDLVNKDFVISSNNNLFAGED